MLPIQLLQTLQLMDSFYPVGAFAYSDGLETAAADAKVRDAASLQGWMEHFIQAVFIPCEGLALVQAMEAVTRDDHEALSRIDIELTALRPASAVRNSSAGVGKRLVLSYATMAG